MIVWIALTFPLWVFRAPDHAGGAQEAWLRAGYLSVVLWFLVIWLVKEINPVGRIPTSLFFVGSIIAFLMIITFLYVQSARGLFVLDVYSKLSRRIKATIGIFSIVAYVSIYIRIAELGSRTLR